MANKKDEQNTKSVLTAVALGTGALWLLSQLMNPQLVQQAG